MALNEQVVDKTKTPIPDEEIDKSLISPGSTEIVIDKDDPVEDGAAELMAQVEALRKSGDLLRQRAERAEQDRMEAIKRAEERAAEVADLQKQSAQSEQDSISSALAAAKAVAEKAMADLEAGMAEGDPKKVGEATRRLARAESDMSRLEIGKEEFDERAKVEPAKPQNNDPVERSNLPSAAKDWLRAHPEYLSDPRKNAKIQSLHWDVIDEGHAAYSAGYFESIETHLGLRKAEADTTPTKPRTSAMVSAPVSRTAPSTTPGRRTNSKVELTLEHKEAAKNSGISEEEYAKGLLRLEQEKLAGNYGGRP